MAHTVLNLFDWVLPTFIIGTPLLSYFKIRSVIIFGLLGLCLDSINLLEEVIIGTKVSVALEHPSGWHFIT